jgi:hypothetical protein
MAKSGVLLIIQTLHWQIDPDSLIPIPRGSGVFWDMNLATGVAILQPPARRRKSVASFVV